MKKESSNTTCIPHLVITVLFIVTGLFSIQTASAQTLSQNEQKDNISRGSPFSLSGIGINQLSINDFSAYSLAMPTGLGIGLAYDPLDQPVSFRFHFSYMPVFTNYYPDRYDPHTCYQIEVGYRIWLNPLVLEDWRIGQNMYYFYVGGGVGLADITARIPGKSASTYGNFNERAVFGVQRKVTSRLFLFLEFGENVNWFPKLQGARWWPGPVATFGFSFFKRPAP